MFNMQDLNLNSRGLPPAILRTVTLQRILSVSCSFQQLLKTLSTVCDSKVVVKGIKAVSQAAMCRRRRRTYVIPSPPAAPKPSLTTLRSCHTFFMMARQTRRGIGPESGSEGDRGAGGERRQMQRRRYITGDRDRFDDRGLTETGLSSSISNLFVSAGILTDKQSACDITWTLTEWDSAATRHGTMALSEWIGDKQIAIRETPFFSEEALSRFP